jgi:hypothetical protein
MSYEFNDRENQVFLNAASTMKTVGILLLILAVLGLIPALSKMKVQELVGGAVNIIVAVFLLRAAGALKKVVFTEGDDIAHTMVALSALRGYFFIQALQFLVVGGVVVFSVLAGTGVI